MRCLLLNKWLQIEKEWKNEKSYSLYDCINDTLTNVTSSSDSNWLSQNSYQFSSFFHDVRLIEEFTIFYVLETNISNWTRIIFENVDLVELDVILCVIHNFYDTILYELTSAIITWLKMNAFINKLNKWTSIKITL